MDDDFLSGNLPLEEENRRLRAILRAVMDRSERMTQGPKRSVVQLGHVVALEGQVRARTRDLAETLDRLRITNARLSQAERDAVSARNALADALEAMVEGFAMFDETDRLTMWNSRFCADLPDVRRRIGPGLYFRDYVRIVSESPSLHLDAQTSRADWVAHRLENHRRRDVNFMVALADDQWLQVSEQRMSSGGTAVTHTDVTNMVRLAREERTKLLDEQALMVRATLDHIDQGVMIFDAKARLAGWNQRLRDLFSPPVALLRAGTPFHLILNALLRRRLHDAGSLRQVLAAWVADDRARPPLRLEIEMEGGTIIDLYAQAMPDQGFVMSFNDLTKERRAIAEMHRLNETLETRVKVRTLELESARDEAERANASKSRFVASASHDLLQPLNAAKLFLASLTAMDQTEAQARLVARISSAFGSVEQILGALLDISKFDIGAAHAKPETLPLAPLLDRLREEFAPMARARGLHLWVQDTDQYVRSDPVYLKRILQNLMSNALRYTETGRVSVGLRRRGRMIRLEVRDTGPGIAEDKQAEIFREFVRLDNAQGDSGMGLGLAIVDQACALLGHPLALRSTSGRGTVFSVTVPMARPDPASATPHLPPEPARQALDDLLVLVVENDLSVRTAMIGVLEDWGASPIEAATLDEARALITDLGVPPDIILADYQLDHGATGLDLIAALRADHGDVPAVLITANHDPALVQQTTDQGVLLLRKPVALRRLRRILLQLPQRGGIGLAVADRGDQSFWLRQDFAEN
jgi:signal transduction histidine kinase